MAHQSDFSGQTYANGSGGGGGGGGSEPPARAARSRKERPCDSCRTAKRRCFQTIGEPCVACKAMHIACTFIEPPNKRKRSSAPSADPSNEDRTPSKDPSGKQRFKVENDGEGSSMGVAGPGPQTKSLMSRGNEPGVGVGTGGEGSGSGKGSERGSAGGDGSSAASGVPARVALNRTSSAESRDLTLSRAPARTSSNLANSMGPLTTILHRVRAGPFYADSERSTATADESSHNNSGKRTTFAIDSDRDDDDERAHDSSEDNDLSNPTLDSSRQDLSEPHFSSTSAAEDPSLLSSRVREVSSGGSRVFFVQTPSLVYGRMGAGDKPRGAGLERSIQLLGGSEGEWPGTLLQMFFQNTLPALPILNLNRLRHLLDTEVSSSVNYPSTVLTGILAHTVMYRETLRHLHTPIWVEVYETLTSEFLQPRLQTLQLTVLDLSSRPDKNPGGNGIALARAIGAAQLLGLHLDCTKWALPRWERNLRKRLWWTIVVLDKWISLYQGRPSHVNKDDWDVPALSIDDFDPSIVPSTSTPSTTPTTSQIPLHSHHSPTTSVPSSSGASRHQPLTQDAIDSADSFMALGQLSLILDSILSEFFTVKAQAWSASLVSSRGRRAGWKAGRTTRLRLIESFGADLDRFERGLKDPLRMSLRQGKQVATGVKSMQLAYLGLTVVLGRLTLELFDPEDRSDSREVKAAIESSLDIVESVVRFVEDLNPIDISDAFWFSFTPYHLSNTLSLLIRSLLAAKRVSVYSPPNEPCALLDRSVALLKRYLSVLTTLQHAPSSWEVTERALAKALTLCPSISALVPEVALLWRELGGLIWEGMRKSSTAEVMLATVPGGPEVTGKTNGGGGGGKGQGEGGQQGGLSQPTPSPHPLSVYLAPSPQPNHHPHIFPSPSHPSISSNSTNPYAHPSSASQTTSNTLYNSQRPSSTHQPPLLLSNPPAFPPHFHHPQSHSQSHLQAHSHSQSRTTPNDPHLGLFQSHQLPPQPPFPEPMGVGAGMEFSFETVVGEEDLWASVGDTQGFGWMGLGFEGGGGGGRGF